MIYLIKCDKTNTCKIGYASNPENRLSQLQVGNPFSLEIVSIIDGDIPLEKELHKKFDKYRLKGEWFEYCDDIKNFFDVDEFMRVHPELIKLFKIMDKAEVRLYAYLLKYVNGELFSIKKVLNDGVTNEINLKERTIYTAFKDLYSRGLILKDDYVYRINPFYAFKGSISDRNIALHKLDKNKNLL